MMPAKNYQQSSVKPSQVPPKIRTLGYSFVRVKPSQAPPKIRTLGYSFVRVKHCSVVNIISALKIKIILNQKRVKRSLEDGIEGGRVVIVNTARLHDPGYTVESQIVAHYTTHSHSLVLLILILFTSVMTQYLTTPAPTKQYRYVTLSITPVPVHKVNDYRYVYLLVVYYLTAFHCFLFLLSDLKKSQTLTQLLKIKQWNIIIIIVIRPWTFELSRDIDNFI